MVDVLEYECQVCNKVMRSLYQNQFNHMLEQHSYKHREKTEVKEDDGMDKA